jgi:disulfide oxidoreductase YuzD
MDPISIILSALASGATQKVASALVEGAVKPAGDVAQDAYNGLKTLIKRKFENQGKSASATILDMHEQKPEQTQPLLKSELTEVGADQDEEIIQLAQKVMAQLHPQAAAEGKFNVQISGNVKSVTQQNTGTINIS